MKRIVKLLTDYQEAFKSNNIFHWYHFIKHTYMPKKVRCEKYEKIPENLLFEFLPFSRKKILYSINLVGNELVSVADRVLDGQTIVFNLVIDQIKGKWNIDPLTGYQWPMVQYNKVRKYSAQKAKETNSDIKYPWELSNCHFLVTIAQAYVLTQNEKYLNGFFELLNNWLKCNPVGYGVNWCCTMNVALRSLNIIVAASIFNQINPEFKKRFIPYQKYVYSHMLFIRDNLEYGFVRENHFLSDIVGLKMLSQCFPHDKNAKKIYLYSQKCIKEEIVYQIYPDGIDHEASTCYHGFVLELFLIALATDPKLRMKLNKKEIDCLNKMAEFSSNLCTFQNYPIIGDNDSGRVLDLNGAGPFRREVVCFANQILSGENISNEYSFLLIGSAMQEGVKNRDQKAMNIFYKQGGFAFVTNETAKLLLHSGIIGRKGRGGHGHNDQTSFILDVKNHSFIIDPGSMVYERDLDTRHIFRSTAVHNCVSLKEGIEQNSIWKNRPFKMKNETKATYQYALCEDTIILLAQHFGYEKKCGCICKRKLEINTREIIVSDIFEGNYRGILRCCYTFGENVKLYLSEDCVVAYIKSNMLAEINFQGWDFELDDGLFSPEYGVARQTSILKLKSQKTATKLVLKMKIIFR